MDANSVTSMERARSALSYLNPDDRPFWVKMAFAIKAEFGEDGFAVWADWGEQHPRPQSEVRSTWKSAKSGKVAFGTLIYEAKQAGWKEDSSYKKPSAAEVAERKRKHAERQAAAAAEEAIVRAGAAVTAQRLWDAATPAATHPYLVRKGVEAHGLRVGRFERVDSETGEVITVTEQGLLIPIRDRKKQIHSLQCILPAEGGGKLYLADGAKQGNFFNIGSKPLFVDDCMVFVLAEGYATAATIHEATGHLVLVCFDASNLEPVAAALRERVPDAIILIAADNDLATKGNPGVTIARKVAADVGGYVAIPVLSEDAERACDFNDLGRADGADSVAAFIGAALFPPEPPAPPPWDGEPSFESESPEPNEPEVPDAPLAPTLPLDAFTEHKEIEKSGYFQVLGYDRGKFFIFAREQRQIHTFRPTDFASDAILLMLAPLEWWEMYFPGTDKKEGSINKKKIMDWLFRLSADRGIYDMSRLRGRGAWVDEGRAIFHHGSHLTVDGVRTEITDLRGSSHVYELARSLPLPSKTVLSDKDGQRLVDIAKLFSWSKQSSALLLAGWTFLAPVCGALRWRPHVWITGGAGTGKSTIQTRYTQQLLGGTALSAQGNSTEAGFRQTLKADALPVLFDESEQNTESEKARVQNILALVRQASTDSQAKTLKGTIGGDAMNFHIRSMFCFASIQVGITNQADSDRMTMLAVRKDETQEAAAARWASVSDALYEIERDETISARLLARAIAMLPTIHLNISVFIQAAAAALGSQRKGDQYGTMLAGAWSLMHTEVATRADADALLAAYDWAEYASDAGDMDDSERAKQAILEAKIRSKGEEYTVGFLIQIAAGEVFTDMPLDKGRAGHMLRENGIGIQNDQLVLANTGDAIKNLIAGSQYSSDIRGLLMRLPGASKLPKPVWLAGQSRRCMALPLSSFIDTEAGTAPGVDPSLPHDGLEPF